MSITPSIYTVISKSNPTGVYSRLPNSYINNLVYTPSVRPLNPVKGEQYYDENDNLIYYWDGSNWVSGGGSSLPPGVYYGDYLYWNGNGYVVGNQNVNLGSNSGEKAQGPYNVAIGYQAGFTGGFSSQDPLAGHETGSSVAIGNYAGYMQSANSIAIGINAGYYQDYSNVAIGSYAGYYQPEINNIAIGVGAGSDSQGTGGNVHANGGNSIAIGSEAGQELQSYESVALGFYAGQYNQGHNSVALGSISGLQNQGNYSVSLGHHAGDNYQGTSSISIGNSAGSDHQGNYSVAIGRNTASNYQGVDSVAIGSYAGNTYQGNDSIALGYYAGYNQQGTNSVAIGNASGFNNQGINSVAIGPNSGNISQGSYSVAIGNNAGSSNQPSRSIIINASPINLDASTGGLFINPIRGSSSSQVLFYNPSTKEITYSTGAINGVQGYQGGAGMGFVVFSNTNSYTGLNQVIATGGNVGQFVLVLGGQLYVYAGTGSGYTGPDNSYGYAGDITDESKLVGFQGTQGLQGIIGSTGFQGLQGLQGFQGLIGSTGPQGFQGLMGFTGPTGPRGTQGFQGIVGITGTQGPQGLQGTPGPTGTLSGTVTFTQGSQITANADIDNYSLSDGTLFLMTGAGGINFNGISNGSIGRYLVLINNSASNVIFKQEALTSTTTNRFSLGTSQITVGTNSTITFIYGNTTLGNRWLCIAKQ